MTLTNVYILRLEGGNYYVGKAENPIKRYQEHVDGNGSAWTKKWPPIGIEKIVLNVGPFDEDKYTKEMMLVHGIDKVRGGSYVRIELEPDQITAITKELRGAADQCSECGQTGHFVRNCPLLAEKRRNYDLKEKCSVGRAPPAEFVKVAAKKVIECSTCGRKGHWASTCYAKTDKDGNNLDSDEEDEWECSYCDRTFTTEFGCGVHEKSCREKNNKVIKCYRCGYKGHKSFECYASKHVKGYMLD